MVERVRSDRTAGSGARPRFTDNASRLRHLDELVAIIEGWLRSQASDDAAIATAEGVSRASRTDPVRARGAAASPLAPARHGADDSRSGLGRNRWPGFALRFSEFPKTLDLQAPTLGEHNAEILTQWLGYTPDEVRGVGAQGDLRSGPV